MLGRFRCWRNQWKRTMRCWSLWGITKSCWGKSRPSTGTWTWWWRTCSRCGLRCQGRVKKDLPWLKVDTFPRCFWEGIRLFTFSKILSELAIQLVFYILLSIRVIAHACSLSHLINLCNHLNFNTYQYLQKQILQNHFDSFIKCI